MNRKDFFKNLGLGFASALTTKSMGQDIKFQEPKREILTTRTINLTLIEGKASFNAKYVIGGPKVIRIDPTE